MIQIRWKRIADYEYLAKVWGGWLYRIEDNQLTHENMDKGRCDMNRGRRDQVVAAPIAMVFIPDAEHLWEKSNDLEVLLKGANKINGN